MPEIVVEIELYCAKCGDGICANGTTTRKRNQEAFIIQPCETCINDASDRGFEEGREKGYAEAENATALGGGGVGD